MSSLRSLLSDIFSQAFLEIGLDKKFGLVLESQRPELSQFQCNGAMVAAKAAKKNPRDLAESIREKVKENPFLRDLSVAGPGFINVSVTDAFLSDFINTIARDQRLGLSILQKPQTIVIDFASPNVAKPMHVGHLRSTIIGDSLQRLFRYIGHTVISDNHIGDWGTQMGMLICEFRRRQPDSVYFDESYTGHFPQQSPLSLVELEEMYPVASRKCSEDEQLLAEAVAATDQLQQGRKGYEALWRHFVTLSLETLKKDFDRLDVHFDHWFGESFYANKMQKLVEQLNAQGHSSVSEGAIIIPVAERNDTVDIPPVMLVKSGGGFLYATSDIATITYRMETFHADVILYVVDQRQSLHFEQVFRAVRKCGIVKENTVLQHVGFGTVNGTDGKPFKTRAGGVMKLGDLIEMVTSKARQRMQEAGIAQELSQQEQEDIAYSVGIATLKFADLMNHRTSDYVFDLEKFSTFEGKTGPYILYSAVRIKSILRKAQELNISEGAILPPQDHERSLMLLLCQLPDVLCNAAQAYAPHYLCDFVYTLAQEFNRFYKECHILREPDKAKQASWLALAKLCLRQLELVMNLLGIKIPEKM